MSIGAQQLESKPKLNVVALREISVADVAAQFRRMADEIDSGEIGHIESMVACAEIDGVIRLYGWGHVDGLRATAMLNLGAAKLMRDTLEQMED